MSPHVLGTAWYRFRATFSQRWGAYLSVILLIGLVGGVAMESPDPTLNGPNLALVRLRAGISPSVGSKDLQRIARAANRAFADVPLGAVRVTRSPLSVSNARPRSSTTAPSA